LCGWETQQAVYPDKDVVKKIKRTLQNAVELLYGVLNTLRTGDADLRFYITTVPDG